MNPEEVLDVVQLTSSQEDLYVLLQSFGLSDGSINNFLENEYDLSLLEIIERPELEALMPHPLLADRSKCIQGLNEWRISKGLPPVSAPLSNINLNVPTTSRTRADYNANFLIQQSDKGRAILRTYNDTKFLPKDAKTAITQIVVDEFVDRYGKLTTQELKQRSEELFQLFPAEPKFSWYQPTFTTDDQGKRLRLGKYASGSLYFRNVNYKPKFSQSDTCVKETSADNIAVEEKTEEILFSPAAEIELKEIKAWLRHEHDDWEDIKLKWAQTTAYRLNEAIRGRFTIEDLIKEYPLLCNPKGHVLVETDFRYKYPEAGDALFASWSRFRTTIRDVFEADIVDAGGKILLKLLTTGKSTEGVPLSDDSRDCVTIVLLTYLLPTISVPLKQENKKRWKPSFAESKDAFVVHATSLAEVETEVGRYRKRCKQNGWHVQPLLIVVGPELTEITDYLVYFGGSYYRFSTFLKSLEVCFKLFKVYQLPFPAESSGPWTLIGHSLFNFQVSATDVHYRKICRIQTYLDKND